MTLSRPAGRSALVAEPRAFPLALLGLFTALIALAGPPPLAAGVGRWTPVGPPGGRVERLVVAPADPKVLYASAGGSLYRSDDGGERWVDQGALPKHEQGSIPEGHHPAVAVSAEDPDELWSASGFSALFHSTDAGRSWDEITVESAPGFGAFGDPLIDELAAAGPPTLLWALRGAGDIVRSTDGGRTWTLVEIPGTDHRPFTFAIDPRNAAAAWVGVRTVWGSTDGGTTWHELGTGLPQGGEIVQLWAFPGPAHLLFTVARADDGPHLYRSTDGGAHWLRTPLDGASDLAVAGGESGLVYALVGGRIFVSSDRGASWTEASPGLTLPTSSGPLVGDPVHRGMAWVATFEGVAKTTDGGTTWPLASTGIEAVSVEGLTAFAGGRLWVGSSVGLYATADGGMSWSFPQEVDGVDREVRKVVADPQDPSHLWALVQEPFGSDGVLVSHDGGLSFASVSHDLGCLDPTTLALDPTDPRRLWVSGGFKLAACGLAKECALFRSTDGGAHWECARDDTTLLNHASSIVADPRAAKILYAADGRALYRSFDGGSSWEETLDLWEPTRLAIDPLSPDTIWVGSERIGVIVSPDRGRTWRPTGGLPGGPVLALAVDPVSPEHVYAVVEGQGVFAHDAAGSGWQELAAGLPTADVAGALAVDPVTPSRLWVGTEGHGVYAFDRRITTPCEADDTTLCLGDGRFEARAAWHDFAGGTGAGHARPLTDVTGSLWFFGPGNVELLVKVLDGRAVNDHFWVFDGALTNVAYTLVVRDTVTGEEHSYPNPAHHFSSFGDTAAFPLPADEATGEVGGVASVPARTAADETLGGKALPASAAGPCVPSEETLCLGGGRFDVEVDWQDFQGGSGHGHAVPWSDETGFFWFFGPDNVELAIKVLDGRPVDGSFWLFGGALTNVAYTLRVTDRVTGRTVVRENPSFRFASFGETGVFPEEAAQCAGFAGLPCPQGQVCDLDPGFCHGADIAGLCTLPPVTCPMEGEPVCGCNGKTYGNDCLRLAARVAKDHDGACAGGGS